MDPNGPLWPIHSSHFQMYVDFHDRYCVWWAFLSQLVAMLLSKTAEERPSAREVRDGTTWDAYVNCMTFLWQALALPVLLPYRPGFDGSYADLQFRGKVLVNTDHLALIRPNSRDYWNSVAYELLNSQPRAPRRKVEWELKICCFGSYDPVTVSLMLHDLSLGRHRCGRLVRGSPVLENISGLGCLCLVQLPWFWVLFGSSWIFLVNICKYGK